MSTITQMSVHENFRHANARSINFGRLLNTMVLTHVIDVSTYGKMLDSKLIEEKFTIW